MILYYFQNIILKMITLIIIKKCINIWFKFCIKINCKISFYTINHVYLIKLLILEIMLINLKLIVFIKYYMLLIF